MFSSTAAILQDNAGDRLDVGEDFDKEVYRELIELYTSPADWIINMQLSTGTRVTGGYRTVYFRGLGGSCFGSENSDPAFCCHIWCIRNF